MRPAFNIFKFIYDNRWIALQCLAIPFVIFLVALETLAYQSVAYQRAYIGSLPDIPEELRNQIMLIPYGNPVGLDRDDLITQTSGYNEVRFIDGVKNIHTGIDFVPSQVWFNENPGRPITEAVNRSIVEGTVSNIQDQYGALCSYITNDYFKVMYCHCDAFIAKNNEVVKYGDPVCFMGNTGFSTGIHVHVEVFMKDSSGVWNRVDPTPFVYAESYE